MTAGELMRSARTRAGLSQAEVATRTGSPRSQIARWEADQVDPGFSAVRKVLRAYSKTAASHEKVRDVRVITEPFSIENEMMTPKMSLKRKTIEKHYAALIEEMYAGKDGEE